MKHPRNTPLTELKATLRKINGHMAHSFALMNHIPLSSFDCCYNIRVLGNGPFAIAQLKFACEFNGMTSIVKMLFNALKLRVK